MSDEAGKSGELGMSMLSGFRLWRVGKGLVEDGTNAPEGSGEDLVTQG